MKKLFWIIFIFILIVFPKPAFATISFTIANPIISGEDEIEVDTSISGLTSSSCSTSGCYLQAEIRIPDNTKDYFGFTYNNSGEYVDYFSSPSSIDEIKSKLFNFTPVSGAWSGKLRLKNNPEDGNYLGPGQYSIKFRRFSGNSTSSTSDSNVLAVNLSMPLPTATPTLTLTPTPVPTDTPTPTLKPTPTSKPTSTSTPTPTLKPTTTIKPITSPSITLASSKASKILGDKTSSQSSILIITPTVKEKTESLAEQSNNPARVAVLIGVIFLIGCGILIFLKLRSSDQE